MVPFLTVLATVKWSVRFSWMCSGRKERCSRSVANREYVYTNEVVGKDFYILLILFCLYACNTVEAYFLKDISSMSNQCNE